MSKRIVCPACGQSTWRDGGCAMPECENHGEECRSCPCAEETPSVCRCPCYGCKFHCEACWCEPCQPVEETWL